MKKAGIGMADIIWAAAVAGAGLAGSFLAAIKLMGNIYYAEWLTASCLAVLVLLAWLSYLRDDNLMKRSRDSGNPKGQEGVYRSSAKARRVLLLAALFLALASLIMYFFFGIGATLAPR